MFFIGGSGLPPQIGTTSPNGKLGAELQKSDSTLQLRSDTGQVIATVGNRAQSAAFDSTSTRLAVGNADGTVQVWDVATRQIKLLRTFVAHNSFVEGVAFSERREVSRYRGRGHDGDRLGSPDRQAVAHAHRARLAI